MKLLCLSDIHGEAAGLNEILPQASAADAVIIAGDLTHLGGAAEAEAILAPFLSSGVRIIAVAGNMDRDGVRSFLDEKGINLHGRGIAIGSVGFMGLGGGTPSPFGTPWEIPADEAAKALAAGFSDIASSISRVIVSHAPPRGTEVDKGFAGAHIGSEALRNFILAGTVHLCICGHVHEAGGKETTLAGTLCVNVGPFKKGRYALVSIEDGRASVTWRNR